MPELRKRKTPPPAVEKPAKKSAGKGAVSKIAKQVESAAETAVDTVKEVALGDDLGAANGADSGASGKTIDLDGFGGEVETHDGKKVTLKQLVDESKAGVVLFTYPKASTPGCTKQACLFRDGYSSLTTTGLSIYGLSADSPKTNTTFVTKQKLPYTLLCDPSYSLIKAIGMQKTAKGTKRGVFAVGKDGKVLVTEEGGPQATVDAVKKVVDEMSGDGEKAKEEIAKNVANDEAKVADEVADTAAALDG